MGIIGTLIVGLIVGALARFVMPGEQKMGWILTILLGVGGILRGADAVEKMQAGASLVQIYTGLIYRGPALVGECRRAILDWRRTQAASEPSSGHARGSRRARS